MPSLGFVNSCEGEEIYLLCINGYPLASKQGDLTRIQKEYLLMAISQYSNKYTQGQRDTVSDQDSLKRMVQKRRKGGY